MKYNKIFSAIAAGLLLFGAASCSDDWDNHYSEGSLGTGTLWDAINGDSELSNFRDVLAATGYDASLKSSQVFTVFAPTNASFTTAQRDDLINRFKADSRKDEKNTVIKEFVQNHIALYNHSMSPASEDTHINLMNGKRYTFTKSAFADKNYVKSNIYANNGVLYSIKEKADYEPNIYEYIQKDEDLDSVWQFLKKYHIEEFIPEKSVPGEIVNGKTQYLDSVTVIKNNMLMGDRTKNVVWLSALLDSEDSTYWAVLPKNEVWKQQLEKYEKYFQYSKSVADRDSFTYIFPRFYLLAGMQFSKTENPNIAKESIDSIVSPLAISYSDRENTYGSFDKKYFVFDKPYQNIFRNTEEMSCSNGKVLKSSQWNADPTRTILKEIIMEGENRNSLDSLLGPVKTKPITTYISVPRDSSYYGQISRHGYIGIAPAASTNPGALFKIDNVLSNVTYDLYLVTAPDILSEKPLPTKFTCNIIYHDMEDKDASNPEGKEVKKAITNAAIPGVKEANDNDYDATARAFRAEQNVEYDAEGHPTRSAQPIKLGTFTFPTCSYGLTNTQIKLEVSVATRSTEVRSGEFTNTIFIDCIKLVPHVE